LRALEIIEVKFWIRTAYRIPRDLRLERCTNRLIIPRRVSKITGPRGNPN
jgi:hypothetical protein